MSMIDDIKRDRESGTDGPWSLYSEGHGDNGYTVAVEGPSKGTPVVAWGGFDFRNGCSGHFHAETDARRIARLPDLEAAYLAEVERNKALVEAGRELLANIDLLMPTDGPAKANFRAALAAYEGKNDG